MNPAEYSIMARVEDVHWWYAGLRGMIRLHWERYGLKDGRILDIGCGTGANAKMISRYGEVSCADMSDNALAYTRERGLRNLEQAALPHLPHSDDTFDSALLMDVLYHRAVPDKTATLREIYRVLKSDGLLFVNVPAYQWLRSSHDDAIHTDKRFTRGEVVLLLEDAGFRVERATYWNTLLFPVVAAIRILRKARTTDSSDLDGYKESIATRLLGIIIAFERAALSVCPMPFGLSIFVVARKVT